VFRDLVENPLVQLVSVMDHSPGQRQLVLESKYREYYMSKYHPTTTQMDELITLRHDHRRVPDHRRGVVTGSTA
jgi:alpha-D-ribose 1-methylphosphonate 5-triphosphate diphosphatase